MELTRRWANLSVTERSSDGENQLGFIGHAAVFGSRTYIGYPPWGFFEEISRGAFAGTLGQDVRMLLNHDSNFLLARTTSGSLRLSEDDVGLAVDADMADTSYARDLAVLMDRGDLTQMSFAFWPGETAVSEIEITDDETGTALAAALHTIEQVRTLYDVSPVTYAAYPATDGALRNTQIRSAADEGVIARGMMRDADLREMEIRAIELRPRPFGMTLKGQS